MTYYLKYRPQTISELDLENVREQLSKIVTSGTIPHGFLFAGPKGTGKTSSARILAKIVNCEHPGKDGEPCGKCDSCAAIQKGSSLDVVEIDAASNRGIDDIRALKENIMLAPSASVKKIYIIDEAHMLTLEASNAFLKTLEEPPEHVIFILATTDPGKLPDTVRSRLVTVSFKKATGLEIERQIERVAKGEGLTIDKEAIAEIAKASDGSFRDAVKILEQLTIQKGKKIKKEDVEEFVKQGSSFNPSEFYDLVLKKDVNTSLKALAKLVTDGVSVRAVIDSLIEKSRENILEGENVRFIELLLEARWRSKDAFIPELPLEIAIVKFCESEAKKVEENKVSQTDNGAGNGKAPEPKIQEKASEVKDDKPEIEVKKTVIVSGSKVDDETWGRILATSKTKNTTIEALLRAAEPLGFDGSNLTLGVYYKFHKERLESLQIKTALEDVVAQVFGSRVQVVYTLTEKKLEPIKEPIITSTKDKDVIAAAKDIFGK